MARNAAGISSARIALLGQGYPFRAHLPGAISRAAAAVINVPVVRR